MNAFTLLAFTTTGIPLGAYETLLDVYIECCFLQLPGVTILGYDKIHDRMVSGTWRTFALSQLIDVDAHSKAYEASHPLEDF